MSNLITLPTEILQIIFSVGADEWNKQEKCIQLNSFDENPHSPYPFRPPTSINHSPLPFQVLVSHVSSQFRKLALEFSALWSTLSISSAASLSRSHIFAQRSGQSYLQIYIDCSARYPRNIPGVDYSQGRPLKLSARDVQDTCALVFPLHSRWRSFQSIVCDQLHTHPAVLLLQSIPAPPHLEFLQIKHTQPFADNQMKRNILPFTTGSPPLRSIRVSGIWIDWDRRSQLFQGARSIALESHNGWFPSWFTFGTWLHSSPRLTSLSLNQSNAHGTPGASNILLPELQHMSLQNLTPEWVERFIRCISVPVLVSMVLDLNIGDFTSFVEELATSTPPTHGSMLSRLEKLELRRCNCSSSANRRMFGELKSLVDLHLGPLPDRPEKRYLRFLRARVAGGNEVYIPRLRSLSAIFVTGKQMRGVVSFRIAQGCALEMVHVQGFAIRPKNEQWLRENLAGFFYERVYSWTDLQTAGLGIETDSEFSDE